jgi:O-antigen ligase
MALRTKADPGLVSRGFFLGGSVGGLAAACFSAYSLLLHPGVRVGVPITNPIPFGQIAAILALIAFVSIFYSSRGWEKVLSVLGFLGGIITLSASGSYGAILGFAIGVLVALAFVSRNRLSRSVWVGILCLALASICIISPWVLFRFNQLLFDVQSFTSGAGMGTSQGQRLILWGISIHELSNSPFFGVGPGHFRQALLRFCATSNCSIGFTPINHAHSQYFDSAINAGLIGLLGLLISLCAPVVLFFRQVPITRGPAQASAIAGLSVVACAMGSMISQPLFAHNISVLTYVVTISICWYLSLSTPARVASVPLHS